MIPGLGKQIKDIDIDDNAFKTVESMIESMTPYEREHPDFLIISRRTRIAKGSGNTIEEVNRMTKQFEQMRKAMKLMSGNKFANLARSMQRRF